MKEKCLGAMEIVRQPYPSALRVRERSRKYKRYGGVYCSELIKGIVLS